MTERIRDIDLCDVLAEADDYLEVAYMAVQSLDRRVASPLLLVLCDAQQALRKAKNEMDTRYADQQAGAAA
jgi:hypothetical protein